MVSRPCDFNDTQFGLRGHVADSIWQDVHAALRLFEVVLTKSHDGVAYKLVGSLADGRKCCWHLHGYRPYFLIKLTKELSPPQKGALQEALREDNAKLSSSALAELCQLEYTMKTDIYGYHEHEDLFLKVSSILRIGQSTKSLLEEYGLDEFYEFDHNLKMKMMIDLGLLGMDYVYVRKAKYRIHGKDPSETLWGSWTVKDVCERGLVSHEVPVSLCAVEMDIQAGDVMNNIINQQHYVHCPDPGLDIVYREEKQWSAQEGVDEPSLRGFRLDVGNTDEAPVDVREQQTLDRLKTAMNKEPSTDIEVTSPRLSIPKREALSDYDELGAKIEECEQWPDESYDDGNEEDVREHHLMSMTVAELGKLQPQMTQKASSLTAEEIVASPISPFVFERILRTPATVDRPSPAPEFPRPLTGRPDAGRSWCGIEDEPGFASRKKLEGETKTTGVAESGSQAPPNQDSSQAEELSIVSNLSVASMELIALTDQEHPDVENDRIISIAIAYYRSICEENKKPDETVIFTERWPFQDTDSLVHLAVSEFDLIKKVVDWVIIKDVDLLIGYDCDRLSWGYFLARMNKIGGMSLSRFQPVKRSCGLVYDPKPTGRNLLSVWESVRKTDQRAHDRGTATKNLLSKRIAMLGMQDFNVRLEYLHTARSTMENIINLACNNVELMVKMNVFTRSAEMARIIGFLFKDVMNRGSQYRVEQFLMRYCRQHNMTVPTVTSQQRALMPAPEQLQLVMEPAAGLYLDPVIVLDFQSLYPSVAMAYNYDFSTCIGHIDHVLDKENCARSNYQIGALYYSIPRDKVREMTSNDSIHISPVSGIYVKPEKRTGVLPYLLRNIIDARLLVKKRAKKVTHPHLKKVLESRQLALKLVANTTYGYTAANASGRMPMVEVADAILSKGREILERAVQLIERRDDGYFGKSKVIYGDTDSVFVLAQGHTVQEAFEFGRRIAKLVTESNLAPIELKLEKVYNGCCLETKKRYAGMKFESPDQEEGVLECKGIETVRRDTCPVVAKSLEKLLYMVLNGRLTAVQNFLSSALSQLPQFPHTDFVFAKEYGGRYSVEDVVPQVVAAKQRTEANPSWKPLVGERIPYLIVKRSSEGSGRVVDGVVPLGTFDGLQEINYEYYGKCHILPALQRVLDVIDPPVGVPAVSWPSLNRCTQLSECSCVVCAANSAAHFNMLVLADRFCNECMKNGRVRAATCNNLFCAVKVNDVRKVADIEDLALAMESLH